MATKPKAVAPTSRCEVEFEGILPSSVRSKLIYEIIKYVLYQRNQIPLPFDIVKKDYSSKHEPMTGTGNPSGVPKCSKAVFSKIKERKLEKTIEGVAEIARLLNAAFAQGYDIRTVLLMLGSTIVSPKEVYHIQLPMDCHDGHILDQQTCQKLLFSNLVSSDLMSELQEQSSITKLTVLLQAPQDCDFSELRLLTKPTFKIPQRGKHFIIDFKCNAEVFNSNVSHIGDNEFDISGIENLEKSIVDIGIKLHSDVHVSALDSNLSPITPVENNKMGPWLEVPGRRSLDVMNSTIATPRLPSSAYMWYQLPATVTGFKDQGSQGSSSSCR